jgi:hypothetical protein
MEEPILGFSCPGWAVMSTETILSHRPEGYQGSHLFLLEASTTMLKTLLLHEVSIFIDYAFYLFI